MAGPIIVEGPDGQEYEFPEGTSPDVMKQAMRKRYGGGTPAQSSSPFIQKGMNMVQGAMQSPQMRANLPGATEPDRMQNRTDSAVLAKARKVEADIANATRKARVRPVEREAGMAGIAQLDQGPVTVNPNVYLGPGSEFMLPPDAQRGMQAEREVYRANDVTSSVDAASLGLLNSTLAGLPGILNKDFRGELAAASEDQPGAYNSGTLAGIIPTSIGMWNAFRAPVNALARPFTPTGADAASRFTRYAAPRAGEVAGVAAQNAYLQGAVFEPVRAEQAGEDLTLGGMGAAAARGLQDPFNLLPLGLSGINRTWNALTSGIATPSARAAQMANQFGVGPRQTSASQGIAQTTQQLGGQLQGADIRGLTNIENALRFALRDNPNIRDVNARIADGFQRIRQSLPLEDDPTLNLARLIEREFANDAPQTRDIIRRFLLKVGMESPGGEAIVGGAANTIRGQQADVLRTEAESAFGAQPRAEANAAIQGSLDQFSQAYNTLLPQAPRTGPQVDRARALLAREPQTMAILDDLAQSQNLTAEQFIDRNPLQALHEVQSELGRQARAARASGADAGPLEITVRNMQRPLREGVPGYGELQGLWRQWTQARDRMGYVRGAEAGTAGELDTVPGFGDKVLGAGGVRNSEMGTQTAADVFLQMDELSQRAAGLSVRDVISDELRKMKAAGVDQRYAAPARMAQVATEGGLDALRRVFGEAGDRVARRIEQFIDANDFARAIDPQYNSATMNKGQAMATGAQPFASGMGQRAQGMSNAVSESAIADSVLMLSGAPPIISAMRAPGIVGRMLQPGQRTQRNIAQTLLRRGEIGSQVPPPPGGPPPIMPIDPANVPGGGAPPNSPAGGGGQPPRPVPSANALSGQPAPAGTSPNLQAQIMWPTDIVSMNADGTAVFRPGSEGAKMAQQGTTPSTPIAAGGFAGLRTDLGAGVGGALFSGAMPMEEDATLQDRLQRAGTGFLLGYGASKGGRVGARMLSRNALAGETRTAGMPKTPQQAARFETSGSPEYEAAVAKGLDMSTPARMARRKAWQDEAGTDPEMAETVLYHGTDKKFDAFRAGDRGIFLGDKETASTYGEPAAYYIRGELAPRSVLVQVKKEIKADREKSFFGKLENERPAQQRELVKRLKAMGYAGYKQGMGIPGALGEVVIFDPTNIRSVNAAFDPDKAASPILTAGLPGGRGPRKPPGKSKLGTRAADAAAITTLAAGGPTAQADTGDGQQRINELAQREKAAQQLITEYEQGLKDFQGLSVKEKQIFLRDNGFTGIGGAILKDDGNTGGNTTYAINNYTQKMQEAIAAAQAERELFRKQINDVRVSMAEQDRKPSNPWVDKGLEIGTYAAAIYAAHRFRGAALKGSQRAARLVEDDANSLLTRMPVPPSPPKKTLLSRVPVVGRKEKARIAKATNAANKAARAVEERLAGRDIPPISSNPTSENGLPIRQANVDEFDRRRAAGDFGPVGPVGRFMEPVTSRFRPGDASIMAAGATDAYVMEGMLDKTREDIATEEKRLDDARKASDPVRIAASNKRLEELRNIETTFTILQRVGIGLAIGGAIGVTHGRYAKPQPRFEAAARERELIRLAQTPPPSNALAPPAPAPKQPRTPPAPKPKPPVSFSNARPRKPANDAD